MYKCTLTNDVKENAKSSFHFYLISCIYIIFVNMEKQESQFFLVITVLRKWGLDKNEMGCTNATKHVIKLTKSEPSKE